MFYVPVQVLLQNIKIKCELKLSVRVSSNIEKESVGQCLGYIFLFSFPITFSAHFLHLTLSRTLELKILELVVQQQNKHYYISLGVPCAMVLCCGIQSTYAAISFMKKVYSRFSFFPQPTQQLVQG